MKISFLTLIFCAVVASAVSNRAAQSASSFRKKGSSYFQYANAPSQSEYEYGYNLGNPFHRSNLYHQTKDHRFRTKVMWEDSVGGTGQHYWEFNHGDAKSAASVDADAPAYPAGPSYSTRAPSYSASAPSYSAASSSYKSGSPSSLPAGSSYSAPSFSGGSPFYSAAAPSFSDASRRYSQDFPSYDEALSVEM